MKKIILPIFTLIMFCAQGYAQQDTQNILNDAQKTLNSGVNASHTLEKKQKEISSSREVTARSFSLTEAQILRVNQIRERQKNFVPVFYKPEMAAWTKEQTADFLNKSTSRYMEAVFGEAKTKLSTRKRDVVFYTIGKSMADLLSEGPAPLIVDASFNYNSLLKDNTDVLICAEAHEFSNEKQFAQILKELSASKRLGGVGTEFILSHVSGNVAQFQATGNAGLLRMFKDSVFKHERKNEVWLPYARMLPFIPLENTEDSFLGLSFKTRVEGENNNFIDMLLNGKDRVGNVFLNEAANSYNLYRNVRWADKIENAAVPGKVFAVNMGQGHAMYNGEKHSNAPSVPDLLLHSGKNTVVIYFAALGKYKETAEYKDIDKMFLLVVPESYKDQIPFDYIINLPQ
ncbi:hypothetical protein Dip510_000131 [Elusimicrobium posterum]|uniref:DEAD/DEAH box helicase family protein n=1 Tax=Elusimicrobium posterum TaxID=3116653 RepID=UPI003C76EF55